jgi:hypothetical protein
MSGLTNKYVEDIGKKHSKNFIGTFPCNIHPDVQGKETFSLVFNESKHNEEGSHFVCVFAEKNKIYYYDSLGLKCENKYILEFLNTSGRKIKENDIQIQSYDSIFCGYFCLSFVFYMSKGYVYEKYFKIFDKNNLKLNDKIVIELLLEIINKKD